KNGEVLTRYQNLGQWIEEAERVFGKKGQREFWQYCYDISQFVWDTSLKQLAFPPSSFQDIIHTIKNFQPNQVYFARLAYQTVGDLLRKYGLDKNELFVDFINEQLVITAQNYLDEVNILFGATALSYTHYTNYYIPGGLLKLVEVLQKYIEDRGGKFELRNGVQKVSREGDHYKITAKKGEYKARYVVSSIPLNNTLDIFDNPDLKQKYRRQVMDSSQLNSAFSFGFAAKRLADFDCIHHQIHLEEPLPYTNAKSIFLSLSHHEDHLRCKPGQIVGSVSTHIHDPANRFIEKKEEVENTIIDILEEKGFLKRDDLLYYHSSTPKAWEKWTGRQWGFVGGYPQYFNIKPWQMVDSRLDGKG
ncbi:MAG: FAD-dependent oxidoreductase, partial [Bacteroidetes bacterium]|nr:FAD-dependent oxidoreductase [Bacteroidota bacterium]